MSCINNKNVVKYVLEKSLYERKKLNTMKNNKGNKEFSITSINRIISNVNKTGLIIIIACYVLILILALNVIGKDISYTYEPNYAHQYYNDEINPQITLVGVYDVDSEDRSYTTKYSISVNIAGRKVDSKDPNYKISSFKMFSSTKKELSSNKVDNTYYFTEHSTYSTPITHTFTLDSSSDKQHPSQFYVRLQYEKGDTTKVETFKEEVFLQPTSDDIDGMNAWYDENKSTAGLSSAKIYGVNSQASDASVGKLEAQCYMETKDGKQTGTYKAGLRISLNDNAKDKFHVDMQSWVVTSKGEYLPFVGVYSYTGSSKQFTKSLLDLDSNLKPEYIVAKVVYRDTDNKTEYVSYFKQNIDEIESSFGSTQTPGDAGNYIKNNKELYMGIAVVAGVVLVGVVISCSYVFVKKSKKEN